jgi:Zn-dependent peptidase ImmA (M78 family)/transcriptional regulator with XRE-family HTH domain
VTLNPEMVRLTREARGLTQAELAQAAGVQQGTVSKVENGLIDLEPERVDALAHALGYPAALLREPAHTEAVLALFHRKLRTTPASKVRAAQARVNLARLHLSKLLSGVELEHAHTFPQLDLDALEGDVEVAAQTVRRTWRLPMGPIRNMTAAVEAAGGIIAELDFGEVGIDAAAQWPRGDRPYFFMRPALPPDRWRFNLAHEVGHMVLHDAPGYPDLEAQAHAFAGALLVPAEELRPQIPARLTLASLLELKLYWGVSMAMLVMRASQIGAITDRQKRSYFQMANARGMRKVEPGRVPAETPTLVRKVLDAHMTDMGYSPTDLSRVALLHEDEMRTWLLPGASAKHAGPRGLHVVR